MNYFDFATVAERYAKGRPFFHDNTIEHIQHFFPANHKFEKALDIACGTGLSTHALLKIAKKVYGSDSSEEMLKCALSAEQIIYLKATAEKQPFDDGFFDLITVGSGLHWFEVDKFFEEANRLLKSKAWLLIYDNYFISEMVDEPNFAKWYPEVYLKKFPAPKRNKIDNWSEEYIKTKHFQLKKEEEFKNPIIFTKDQLILYFTTQSNITDVVNSKQSSYEEVEKWLSKELDPFFVNSTPKTLLYGNWLKFLKKLQ